MPDDPTDLTPEALAALPFREWAKLDPAAIDGVFDRLRDQAEAPQRAREAAARAADAAGRQIANDADLTRVFLAGEAERRAAREQQRDEEIARSRPQESFPIEREGA